MNILVLSTWFPYPPSNGARQRAHYLLRALARAHQVTLVAFRPPEDEGAAYALPPEAAPVALYPVPADAFQYVHASQWVKFASPIPLAFWPIRAMRQTVAQVSHTGPWDAVVAFQSPAARYALTVTGVPRVLEVDTALSYQMRARYLQSASRLERLRTWISWQKARAYETWLCRQFQACTVAAAQELGHVQALTDGTGCRVQVIPNGVDCAHNRMQAYPPVPHTLVYNGSLTYSANHDAMRYFLSDIYPLVRRQAPETSLTITGSTAGVDLAGLPRHPSVCFSGYVPDIRPVVAGASVCVVPLRQGGGTRLKILEAMALGTPVVSTTKGAEGLEVTDGEHILIADDPATFAAHTLRLLRDAELRQRLAQAARRLVEERYDWEQIGQRFVALVEEAVAGRPREDGTP